MSVNASQTNAAGGGRRHMPAAERDMYESISGKLVFEPCRMFGL